MGENWIDLEVEIKEVVQRICSIKYEFTYNELDNRNKKTFRKINQRDGLFTIMKELDLVSTFVVYKQNYERLRNKLRDDFRRFVYALEIYLDFFVRRWAEKTTLKLPEKIRYILSDDLHILTFNYTDYYDVFGPKRPPQDRICFIHGKLRYIENIGKKRIEDLIRDSNIVLGFEEYLEECEQDKQLAFVHYRKYFQRIEKSTGDDYLDWVNDYKFYDDAGMKKKFKKILRRIKAKKKPNHIYIYGHSMDPTDKEIFKDLFLRKKNDTRITIYCYNDDAREMVIENLIAIIGKNELIRKTRKHRGEQADIEIVSEFTN